MQPSKKRSVPEDSDPAFQPEEEPIDTEESPVGPKKKKPPSSPVCPKKQKKSSVPACPKKRKTPLSTGGSTQETKSSAAPKCPKRATRASSKTPKPGKSASPSIGSAQNDTLWNVMSQRKIHPKRMLTVEEFEEVGVVELLKKQKLFGTMSKIQPFIKNIVVKFYSNLLKAIKDPRSATFHKVLVRGTTFNFSLTTINNFFESHVEPSDLKVDFDKVISELTASVRCLWTNETSFPAADLSLKYSALYKIAVENWLPTFHTTGIHKQLAKVLYIIGTGVPFDVGKLIFEEIVSLAEVISLKPALLFPSLVYGLLMSQQNIRTLEDVLEVPTKPIRIS